MCHPLPYKRITINTWSICMLGILELCSSYSVSQNSSYNIDTKYIHPLTAGESTLLQNDLPQSSSMFTTMSCQKRWRPGVDRIRSTYWRDGCEDFLASYIRRPESASPRRSPRGALGSCGEACLVVAPRPPPQRYRVSDSAAIPKPYYSVCWVCLHDSLAVRQTFTCS